MKPALTLARITGILLVLVGVISFTGCATDGILVPLDGANLDLLEGRWEGKIERTGTAFLSSERVVHWETSVVLEVSAGRPLKGLFFLGAWDSWETDIRVRRSKAILRFGTAHNPIADREFVLKRSPEGKLRLEASYDQVWEGWDRTNSIVLEKK